MCTYVYIYILDMSPINRYEGHLKSPALVTGAAAHPRKPQALPVASAVAPAQPAGFGFSLGTASPIITVYIRDPIKGYMYIYI